MTVAYHPRKEPQSKALRRTTRRYPVAQGRVQGGKDQKKECLNLTNKAVMLLKTKDRENEQSRTKPILAVRKPSAVAGGRGAAK